MDRRGDYNGSDDIASDLKTKLLSQYSAYTSTDTNAKATAYLLDTSIWNTGFKNNTYADYAIGGATIELFAKSYNATHDIKIETQVIDSGYRYRISNKKR